MALNIFSRRPRWRRWRQRPWWTRHWLINSSAIVFIAPKAIDNVSLTNVVSCNANAVLSVACRYYTNYHHKGDVMIQRRQLAVTNESVHLFFAYVSTANGNMSLLGLGILFCNEDTDDWTKFWKFIKSIHPSVNTPCKTIMTDQDKGSITAIVEILHLWRNKPVGTYILRFSQAGGVYKRYFGRAHHRKLARRAGRTSCTPCSSVSHSHAWYTHSNHSFQTCNSFTSFSDLILLNHDK